MVVVTKEICGNPPSVQTFKEYYCDSCDSRCGEGYDSLLYEYEGEQLCIDCLMDVLRCNEVFRKVE